MLHSYVIGTLGKCKPAKEPKGKPMHNLVQSNKMLRLEIDKVLLAQPTHKCLAVLDASRKQMRSCQHLFAHSHLSLLCFRSGCYLRPSMIRTEIQRGPTTWVSVSMQGSVVQEYRFWRKHQDTQRVGCHFCGLEGGLHGTVHRGNSETEVSR